MIKIKDFEAREKYAQPMLIKSCTKGTTAKGAPYLTIVFQDNSGSIDGKFWDVKPETEENCVVGHVVDTEFEALEYNGNLQLRVFRVTDKPQDDIDMSEYLISGNYAETELRQKVEELVKSVQNEKMRLLVEAMFRRVGENFYTYPAASRIHHGYLGGLAEHTLGMAALAEQVALLYPSINRDLLICGILMHDMGKTAELSGVVASEYTLEGKLAGHISICHGWLMEAAEELVLENEEETLLLRHMILSHHGKYEFGSPVLPELREAEVLNLIDNLDARMNILDQAMEKLKPGQWTQKIFALENRTFYKPKV